MVHPGTVVGDQLQLLARLCDHGGIDLIGDRWHQHIRISHRLGQLCPGHRHVVQPQLYIEQFRQPCLNGIRQPSRDYNTQPFL